MTMAQWENERVYARFRTSDIPSLTYLGARMCVMCSGTDTLAHFPCGCVVYMTPSPATTIHIVVVAVVALAFNFFLGFSFSAKLSPECEKYCFVSRSAQDHFTQCIPEPMKTTWIANILRCSFFFFFRCADTPYLVSVCVNGRVFFRYRLVHLDYVMWRIVLLKEFLSLDFFHSSDFFVCTFFGARRIVACLSFCLIQSHSCGQHLPPQLLLLLPIVGRAVLSLSFVLVRSTRLASCRARARWFRHWQRLL